MCLEANITRFGEVAESWPSERGTVEADNVIHDFGGHRLFPIKMHSDFHLSIRFCVTCVDWASLTVAGLQ